MAVTWKTGEERVRVWETLGWRMRRRERFDFRVRVGSFGIGAK